MTEPYVNAARRLARLGPDADQAHGFIVDVVSIQMIDSLLS